MKKVEMTELRAVSAGFVSTTEWNKQTAWDAVVKFLDIAFIYPIFKGFFKLRWDGENKNLIGIEFNSPEDDRDFTIVFKGLYFK